MRPLRLLVTGGTGFIGSAVLRASARCERPLLLRLLVHQRVPPDCELIAPHTVTGDITDPRTLEGCFDGIDAVLHLAGVVSDREATCMAVNGLGTENVVTAATAAGVPRILYVSTAAVYGYASHSNAREDEVAVRPATPVSRSRARAERAVLAAGGAVVRPLFVYGSGDARFLPVVARALGSLPVLVDRGRARISVISVDDLAAALLALATLPSAKWQGGPYHATDGAGITFRELVLAIADTFAFEPPRHSLPYGLVRSLLRVRGARVLGGGGRWSPSVAHRLFLVARDHTYDSSRLWHVTGLSPSGSFPQQLTRYASWYRRFSVPEHGAVP